MTQLDDELRDKTQEVLAAGAAHKAAILAAKVANQEVVDTKKALFALEVELRDADDAVSDERGEPRGRQGNGGGGNGNGNGGGNNGNGQGNR